MRKILYFITQSEFGGAQRYVFDLANNLKSEFQVAVALGEQGKGGKLAKILEENNIEYYIIPHLKRSISPLNELLALREIIKLIKQYQPNIIHLNSSKISILGSIAALCVARSTLRVIYTVHGWVFNEPLSIWLKYFYLFAEKFTARFKDKIICVSEFDRQTALQCKIAPAAKLITIHNGILSSVIPASEPESRFSRSELLSGLRIKSAITNNLLIGSIGNLYKTKGYEYFIEAAHILITNYQLPITFIIIGEGNQKKYLQSLINKYNLQNNFILAGQIDQAASLLTAFDVYVCSSVKEGLPYSILEAMAAGLPIISTNVGGIPEMIEHNKTGLLVEPANARELAEKIKIILENRTLGYELGQDAKIKAAAEFSLKKMTEKTKKIYSS